MKSILLHKPGDIITVGTKKIKIIATRHDLRNTLLPGNFDYNVQELDENDNPISEKYIPRFKEDIE